MMLPNLGCSHSTSQTGPSCLKTNNSEKKNIANQKRRQRATRRTHNARTRTLAQNAETRVHARTDSVSHRARLSSTTKPNKRRQQTTQERPKLQTSRDGALKRRAQRRRCGGARTRSKWPTVAATVARLRQSQRFLSCGPTSRSQAGARSNRAARRAAQARARRQ